MSRRCSRDERIDEIYSKFDMIGRDWFPGSSRCRLVSAPHDLKYNPRFESAMVESRTSGVVRGGGVMKDEVEVVLFTDGACQGNPGPGGWGYMLRHVATGNVKKAAGGDPATTNNRMELQAVIEGLKAIKRRTVVRVVTDSQYVSRGMSEWVEGWIRNGWRRGSGRKGKPVKNMEIWQELVSLCDRHEVTFQHVLGHAGHPENEECDSMAVAAAKSASRNML